MWMKMNVLSQNLVIMAKRSQRRHVRYEKDQAGCIWGFISMFDFRNGRSTRKLLSDRRHPSRPVVGAGYSRSKLHMLSNSNINAQEIYDGEERATMIADAAKTSVKELMEEEMFTEQDPKRPVSSADTEAKESDSERPLRVKKNRKRTSKTSKSSGDIHCEFDAVENRGPENSSHRVSEEKSSKNLDLEVVVNELCQKIRQKSTSHAKHDSNIDLVMQSEQTYSVFGEKLKEAIKAFLDQRSTDGKHPTEDGKIDQSKEFMDALQTSRSNKELILELLKGPNSLLMKHIEDLEGARLEKDRTSNSLALNNSKPHVSVVRKQHNFFRRRSKSQEKISLMGNENCQTSNRIVILKPGRAGVKISETERKLSPSLQSDYGFGTKVQTEKIASQFSFTEIKRKLKNAMGKERHRVPSDDIMYRFPNERQYSGNTDKVGWNSPNRNHFYNERFARPNIGIKNKDKSYKSKDTEKGMGNGTVEYAEQRVSNIYVEAKKHLSEMLNDGDEIEDFSSRQLPKTLGRILSLPEFNFSPIYSPGHSFVTAQQRFCSHNNFHVVNEDTLRLQENRGSHPSPSRQNLNSQSCISAHPEEKVQPCNSNSDDAVDELDNANIVEGTLCSMRPENSSEGDVTIVQTADVLVQEESKVLDISDEQCSSSVVGDDQNGDLAEVCDEEESAQCLKLDSFEQEQLTSSPLTSPQSSSITVQVGDSDGANEKTERPSPVSVLEPIFREDDISPAGTKSQPVEPPIQPLQIHFEEQLSSATNQEICVSVCLDDEESAFEYVEAILLASDLNWEEFLLRWLSSDEILDASLFDEVELFSNRSWCDQKLLFDCTNEVLKEVCERYFGYSPWVSFVKHNIRPIPRGKDLIHEVWEGVEWDLLPEASPRTLDQIVRKDMAKIGTWMDLQFDVESVGVDIGEAVFEELVEDAISSFVNEGSQID
ncbi:unnamed protein product [Camellia sinensis]